MKFISFAILSALATLTTAAPAPTQGQCVPEQGQTFRNDYDMTGWYEFNGCTSEYVQIVAGTLKTRSSYNYVDGGTSVNYCGKYHSNTAGAKAVDSQGGRYNLQRINNANYDSTYHYTTNGWESDDKVEFKLKLVGQGQLSNAVVTYSYHCRNSYDPTTGVYEQDCSKLNNSWTWECSA